jgi:Cft2 family RNA processing exonuclease
MSLIVTRELGMTEQEQLYAEFYNKGKVLVVDMDMTALREHREKLAQIAFEAKATLAAADDELRERSAKSKKKEWLITPTEQNQSTTDAINAVQVRKKRMSQIDKMRLQLEKAGIDAETIKVMLSNLERKATEDNLKTVTFTKTVTEPAAVQVMKKKEENGAAAPAFNPASLSFKSK